MRPTPLTVPVTRHPNGRSVVPEDREFVVNYVEALPANWRGTMTLAAEKKVRTRGREGERGNQDGFFFGPIMEILMEKVWFTNHQDEAYIRTLEECSYRLKANPRGGEPIKELVHVSDMDRDGMSAFIEKVQQWAGENAGVFIPDPDPKKSKRWAAQFQAKGYGVPDLSRVA